MRAVCAPARPYWPDHEAATIALRRLTTAATDTATGDA